MAFTPVRSNPVIVQVRDAIEAGFSLSFAAGDSDSSGRTGAATAGATWGETTVLTTDDTKSSLRIYNTSGVAGFFSIDSGNTQWNYLPANSSLQMLNTLIASGQVIKISRLTSGGSDVTGVFISVW